LTNLFEFSFKNKKPYQLSSSWPG